MKERTESPLGLYTIGIAALFLAGFFLLVVFGAMSYRNTVLSQSANNDSRAVLSYLTTVLRAGDAREGVHVLRREEGTQLLVDDGDTGYALRIYLSGGELLEEYAPADAPPGGTEAHAIGPATVFDVREEAGGTLRIVTDAGEALVCLRSEGGAA